MTELPRERLNAAKQAFSTRRVPLESIRYVLKVNRIPRAGDVVLARVGEPGRLERLELTTGRRSRLYPGDEIIVTYGNRYAPDAYEALLPTHTGPCHLAAAGGLAADVIATNLRFADEDRPPTELLPVGICADSDGNPINLSDYALRPPSFLRPDVTACAVFGSSMNSGKTTTAAGIVRGFTQRGLSVGAAKITGTCAGGDLWKFRDAGCRQAYDFTDAGMATTYKTPLGRIVSGTQLLIDQLIADGCDVIVLEIADGIHQQETAALLRDERLRTRIDHWVFAADNAASIALAAQETGRIGLDVRCVSGAVTVSPLALREASQLVDIPVMEIEDIETGEHLIPWLRDDVRTRIGAANVSQAAVF